MTYVAGDIDYNITEEADYFIWTEDQPTEEGWYWVNFKVGSAHFQVIEKYPLDGTEQNMNLATHWLGPLPVPEAPNGGYK